MDTRRRRLAMTGHEPVTVLLDGTCGLPLLLGGKGAALDRLIRWDLPVPATGIVTAVAYDAMVAGDEHLSSLIAAVRSGQEAPAEEVADAFLSAALDPGLQEEIVGLARRVGGPVVAVRSSATVEDLERASFAGQYQSFLGVDPLDEAAVMRALRLVFASLWYPAPCAYRRSFGIDEQTVAMAAVVMSMVPARRAGVVFTLDPGGDPAMARVETVQGLGESLVSGRETPEAVVLPREGGWDGAPAEVREVLALALQVEARAGRPQDVEWAWDGTRVWLVQARPITVHAGDRGDGFDEPEADLAELDLTTAGIGEMLPGVLPPLVWEVSSHLVEEALRTTLGDLGVGLEDLPAPRALVRRVRGRAAMDFGLLSALTGEVRGATADQMEEQYFGSRRPRRPAGSVAPRRHGVLGSTRHDVRVMRARHRSILDAELSIRATSAIAAARPDLTTMADDDLLAYRLRLIDLSARAMTAELGVAAQAAAQYRRLELSLAGPLGETEAARQAARLAAHVGQPVEVTAAASAAVFAGPTWEELGLSPPGPSDHITSAPDAGAGLQDALAQAPGWDATGWRARLKLRSIRRTALEATQQLSRREAAKAAVLQLGGEVRRTHLELGERLVRSGCLEQLSDVDLLSTVELRRCIAGDPPPAPEAMGRRRRRLHDDEAAGPLPARFTGVPERRVLDAPRGDRLEGWAVSGGQFTGRARVVRSPKDPFEQDAVLVAEATDPSWSPLFMRAGAIVLERGGPLAHAAILARELGVPAVTDVTGATRRLDGRSIMVDGDAGIIVILDAEPSP